MLTNSTLLYQIPYYLILTMPRENQEQTTDLQRFFQTRLDFQRKLTF